MKPYPKYKDSGVQWIGQVPEHWTCSRIKFLADSKPGSFTDGDWIESPYITDTGVRLIQTGNVGVGEYREQGYRYVSAETFEELKCSEVMPNDVLICRLAEPVGRACMAPDLGVRMITAVDNCILKPSSTNDARFIVYELSAGNYLSFMESFSRGGTRSRISRTMLGDIPFIAPADEDQKVIADFLGAKTAGIDELIEKKRRQIELLKEYRASVISEAVTKGLNPNVRMKDSGVEWIGKIPQHWTVKPLKYIKANEPNAFVDGPFGSNLKSIHFVEGGDVYVVESGFITSGEYVHGELKTITAEHYETIKRSTCRGGDIIIAKIGANYGMSGILAELDKPAVVSGNSLKLTVNERENSTAFVQMQLLHLKRVGAMELIVNMTAQPALSLGGMNELKLATPPKVEQIEILQSVKTKTSWLNSLLSMQERQIESLQSYRTSLISEAVTGKIDVRDWAKPAN